MPNDGLQADTYDAENRLISSVSTLGNASYVYDANGRRVRKTVNTNTITDFFYDLAGNAVAERQSTNQGATWNWTKGYVYGGGRLLVQYDGIPGAPGAATYFVHTDHLGSTRLLTNVSAQRHEAYDYLPYGEGPTGTGTTNHLFTGLERDAESGLDHTLFRKYASLQGRWLSPDPLGGDLDNPQSLNLYPYVLNNPLSWVDSLGLDEKCTLDQIEIECGIASYLLRTGSAVRCPNNDCFGILVQSEKIYRFTPPAYEYSSGLDCPLEDPTVPCTMRVEVTLRESRWVLVGTVPKYSFEDFLWAAANFSAGAGDFLTGRMFFVNDSITEYVRRRQGTDNVVDRNTGAYAAGAITGTAIGVVTTALATGHPFGLRTLIKSEPADHFFPLIGYARHLRIGYWVRGASGSGRWIQIPYWW